MARDQAGLGPGGTPGFLDRARTIAKPGFNRWLIPPCALAIHLCIGMAYGFSVFWLPMSRVLGVTSSITCPGMGLGQALVTSSCDWRVSDLTWTYSLFFVVLGSAAAIWGGWLERAGPRKAGLVAALCWATGLAIGALAVKMHQLWLLWLGAGVLGGVGLGLGYITPVSTLIKWFPDRRGMATGMAIMGFGGGALVGSPLADVLMRHFGGPTSVGVWQTLLVLSVIYLVFMLGGALGFRVPPSDWRPDGWTPPKTSDGLISTFSVHLKDAHKTPQFWLIWVVLLLNVSASIGIIGVASPMLQEIFAGRLFGHPEIGFAQFDSAQKAAAATTGAGFVGLLSLFNIGGRFGWASFSDLLGRKLTFTVMLALGAVLFGVVATWSATGAIMAVFVLSFCITTSMYGGGFSTVPAYLADIFGTQFVGAIHGRLLTAWSTAGVLGPFIVTTIRDRAIAAHAPRAEIYPHIYLILAGLLVVGLIANLMVRPVAERWHMAPVATGATSEEPAADVAKASGIDRGRLDLPTTLAWLPVVIPLVWGVWVTVAKAIVLFQ